LFVAPAGQALHPADATDHFHDLSRQAELPPIRLHHLRHGAADIYGSILPQLAQDAAEKARRHYPSRRHANPAA
jgi:hypothetical protein